MLYRGVFWVRSLSERDIVTVRFQSDENGVLADSSITSKDINHKRLWERLGSVVTGGLPYNYYPRGTSGTAARQSTYLLLAAHLHRSAEIADN